MDLELTNDSPSRTVSFFIWRCKDICVIDKEYYESFTYNETIELCNPILLSLCLYVYIDRNFAYRCQINTSGWTRRYFFLIRGIILYVRLDYLRYLGLIWYFWNFVVWALFCLFSRYKYALQGGYIMKASDYEFCQVLLYTMYIFYMKKTDKDTKIFLVLYVFCYFL